MLTFVSDVGKRNDCIQDKKGEKYMGTLNTTASGKTCQRWDSTTPHSHDYTRQNMSVNQPLSEFENYCASTSDRTSGPWCHTTDPNNTTEACRVPFCRECALSKLFFSDIIRVIVL